MECPTTYSIASKNMFWSGIAGPSISVRLGSPVIGACGCGVSGSTVGSCNLRWSESSLVLSVVFMDSKEYAVSIMYSLGDSQLIGGSILGNTGRLTMMGVS